MFSDNVDSRNSIDQMTHPRRETRQISVPSTFIRASAKPSGSAETELIYGTLFHIHEVGRGWVWGQSENRLPGRKYPGYVGWVKASHLEDIYLDPGFVVSARTAPVFVKSSIKSEVKTVLSMGSVVSGETFGDFVRTELGFIHKNHARRLTSSPQAEWVSIAEQFLECPYIWGGISGFGLDCSGLVQTALRLAGKDAPRDSDQQAILGKPVEISSGFTNLKRGDLVFWKGHVGIMSSPKELLHANAHHMRVEREPLDTANIRIKKNAGPVTGIRRL